MSKPLPASSRFILIACGVDLLIAAASLLWATVPDTMPTIALVPLTLSLLLASPLVVVSSALLLRRLADRRPKSAHFEQSPIAKTLAVLISAGLVASSILVSVSLTTAPENNRFVYENAARIITLVTIVLTVVLNAVQTEIYWIKPKAAKLLDERQQSERNRVFETSYKLMAVLGGLSVLWFTNYIDQIPRFTEINYTMFPSILYWHITNVLVGVIALPLVVAALRK